MSAGLAYAAAPARPRQQQQHPRHIEIVTSAVQRRARPRLAYALVGVVGLFAIFLAQLLLSIALSDGAYRISTLTGEKRDLSRTEQSLVEQLELVGSSQNLAATAQSLGMVSSTSPAYLRLSDGLVLGAVSAAAPGAPAGTTNLVPNSLLAGASAPFSGQAPAATGTSPASSAPDPQAIPSPVTR